MKVTRKIHEEIRQNRMRDHDEGITLRHLAQKCNREKQSICSGGLVLQVSSEADQFSTNNNFSYR